jgi:DNA adenine methylase
VFRHFPSVIHNYYEPFLGGGSVLLHLLQKIESGEIRLTGKICVSDANPELINTYECVKSHPEALVAHLNKLITEFENADDMDAKKAFFKMQQYIFNKFKVRGIHGIRGIHRSEEASAFTDVIMAATFIFINKTCFRGVYREGKSGDFITPFFYPFNGGVTILDAESVRRTSELYRKYDVSFTTCNYPELINIENSPRVAVVADFVYLDPPYVKLTKSSFVEYVKEGFDDAEFNVWLEELSTTTRLIVNNYATEETLKQFEEWPLTMCYRVSKDANRELLAANFI